MLHKKYFELIETTPLNGCLHAAYRPLESAMVLFSQPTGEPLVSVQIRCRGPEIGKRKTDKRKALFVRRGDSGGTDFQALFTRDEQEFEFVLTNLSGDGMVKVDIMKHDCGFVEDADPGAERGALNKINEIKPFESYKVHSDQQSSRSLVLVALGRESNSTVPVSEAERNGGVQQARYFIWAAPESGCDNLVAKFTETFWACPDVFVVSGPAPRNSVSPWDTPVYALSHDRPQSFGVPWSRDSDFHNVRHPNSTEPMSTGEHEGFLTVQRQCALRNRSGRQLARAGQRARGRSLFERSQGSPSHGVVTLPLVCDDTDETDEVTSVFLSCGGSSSSHRTDRVERNSGQETVGAETAVRSGSENEALVRDSFAAAVQNGRLRQNKGAVKTGKRYQGVPHSPRCAVGLSVALSLSVRPELSSRTELVETARALLKSYVELQQNEWLRSLKRVYDAPECVVCLEQMPDCIILQCGHQCCHKACCATLEKCPLCRQRIVATVAAKTESGLSCQPAQEPSTPATDSTQLVSVALAGHV